jgi:hypothetical protein
MPETKRDYPVGRGKPPVHTRFKKGQPGDRADRVRKTAGAVDRGARRRRPAITVRSQVQRGIDSASHVSIAVATAE